MDFDALTKKEKPNSNYIYAWEMQQNGEGIDCLIEVSQNGNGQQGKEFIGVHKFVLMANSLVFRAMFAHEYMKESRDSLIQIEDSTATTVHQMIRYLYTGELPPDNDTDQDDILLVQIANKYEITPLLKCNESSLIKSLSLENVFDRLELADRHQLDGLKYSCGRMIWFKLDWLKTTDKWAELKNTSNLGFVLDAMAEYHKRRLDDEDRLAHRR